MWCLMLQNMFDNHVVQDLVQKTTYQICNAREHEEKVTMFELLGLIQHLMRTMQVLARMLRKISEKLLIKNCVPDGQLYE